MKSISFRYKALAAAFVLLFSAYYQQPYYNLLLILLLLFTLKVEKIKLFRFPGQVWFFGFFLLTIFVMQSVNGYGTILIDLPFGLYISREGLLSALLFTSGIGLVFLLCATAIYTTPPETFHYYLNRLEKRESTVGQLLYRAGRILLVVMHLIPAAFSGGKNLLQEKTGDLTGSGPEKRLQILGDTIFRFFQELLVDSENEFIRLKSEPPNIKQPTVLPHWGQLTLLAMLLGVHIWLLRGITL